MSARTTLLSGVLRNFVLPTLLCAGACTGTDTGNPFSQPLIVDAHSSAPGEVAIALPAGGALVTEAWLSIDEVGISEACGTPRDASIGNLGVADHAVDEALHVDFEAQETSYCELQVPWVLASDDGQVPTDVVGTAIYLSGQSAAGTSFVLRSTLTGTVTVAAINDSFLLAEDLGGLFLGFDLATWLQGIDLDSATIGGDGSILIDGSNNATLLSAFEDNVAAGLELYRDANSNGRVDGAEDVVLARGQ